MTPKRIVVPVIIVLFALFIIQNAQVVEVRFLFWSAQASRAIALLMAFALGLVTGWLCGCTRKSRS